MMILPADRCIEIDAKVLSNRRPPYSIPGGLFDALTDSGGDMVKVTNEESAEALELIRNTRGSRHSSGRSHRSCKPYSCRQGQKGKA